MRPLLLFINISLPTFGLLEAATSENNVVTERQPTVTIKKKGNYVLPLDEEVDTPCLGYPAAQTNVGKRCAPHSSPQPPGSSAYVDSTALGVTKIDANSDGD